MCHWPWCGHFLELQRDGIRLKYPNPDRQSTPLIWILQDNDRHVRDGIQGDTSHRHLDQHCNLLTARPLNNRIPVLDSSPCCLPTPTIPSMISHIYTPTPLAPEPGRKHDRRSCVRIVG